MEIKTRIIKSNKCFFCKKYLKTLSQQNYDFTIYDADDSANQKQLDEWKVSDMPVVQLVSEDGSVLWQFPPGQLSTRSIEAKKSQLIKK